MSTNVVVANKNTVLTPFHEIPHGKGFYFPGTESYYIKISNSWGLRLTKGKSDCKVLVEALIPSDAKMIMTDVTITVEAV